MSNGAVLGAIASHLDKLVDVGQDLRAAILTAAVFEKQPIVNTETLEKQIVETFKKIRLELEA